MSDSSSIVEFSLVTHASDSPNVHVVLHTFLCSWLTPSFVCSFVFLFSPVSLDRILVEVKKCALPPQPLVDHRPAKKKTWLED